MLTYGSHHQPSSQGEGCTTVGRHTKSTGSHQEPGSQTAEFTAGVVIVAIEYGASATAKTTAIRRMSVRTGKPFRKNAETPSESTSAYSSRDRAAFVRAGRLGLVAWLHVLDVAEGHPVLELVRRVTVDRFQKMRDVVAEGNAIDNSADKPGRRVVENRHLRWAAMPGATVELVDRVARLAAEQFHDADVCTIEHVDRQVGGVGGHSERVVPFGQTDQKSWRMNAGLTGEADETAGQDAVGLRGDDEHRIVQQRHQLLECVNTRCGHPLSLPVQTGRESAPSSSSSNAVCMHSA